ncbi:MAG: hypothetical protein QGD92_11845, partial [Gammaproteobacteria bacterium]|nr:hypothetical protein [Gammaproteobacteria bacterium]
MANSYSILWILVENIYFRWVAYAQELTGSRPEMKIEGVSSLVSDCFINITDLMDRVFLSGLAVSGQELTSSERPRREVHLAIEAT